MSQKRTCVLLINGFEEVEALTPVDILRRLGGEVIIAGVEAKEVTGSHGVKVITDKLLSEVDLNDFDALVLPGGLPGSTNLRDSQEVIKLLQQAHSAGKVCAAICAAPIVLRDSGIAKDKNITGYPGTEQLAHDKNFQYTGKDVEQDGNIISGKGMGKAAVFSFAIAKALGFSESEIAAVADGSFITR